MLSDYVIECLKHMTYVAEKDEVKRYFLDGTLEGNTYKIIAVDDEDNAVTISRTINEEPLVESELNAYLKEALGVHSPMPSHDEGSEADED